MGDFVNNDQTTRGRGPYFLMNNLILTGENGWWSCLWGSNPKMAERTMARIQPGWKVLEIGPGMSHFPKATHFVDRPLAKTDGHPTRPNTTYMDITEEKLPFEDQSFDFVYCRHVLEDLYNPFLALKEIARVGKQGYIEVPSPLAELCRGVDGRLAEHRGYHHHRWIVWEDDEVLHFVEKSVLIEHIRILDFRESILQTPSIANTYYPWHGQVRVKHWQHDHDFNLSVDYDKVLAHAVDASVKSWKKLGL